MKSILAAAMIFGVLSTANAAEQSNKAMDIQTLMAAAKAKVSQPVVPNFCDPKGAACYAEDSWTCCSGICLYAMCN